MKNIFLVSLTSIFLIQSSASAVTCQDKLKKIINRKNSPTYLNGEGSYGGSFSIDVSPIASIPLRIRAKHAQKSLDVLTDAAKGNGIALDAVWEKFKKKHPELSNKTTYAEFAASIHKADIEGKSCYDDDILKKKDFIEIVIEEQAKNCVKADQGCEKLNNFTEEAIKKLNQSK